MILRKPYAFFIKMFKPIHFAFCISLILLIAHQNKILNFLNDYLYTTELIDTQNIKSKIISSIIIVLPIIIIIISLLLFGIMYKKKKPYIFYFISIFIYLYIVIVNVYVSNFFTVLESNTIAIKNIKLIHDLVLINILLESSLFLIYLVRGFGINFKKFDFSSDIAQFDINEKDKEEFEFELKIDFNESKRKRKEKLRNFKYFYLEHKFIINSILSLLFSLIIILIIILIISKTRYNKEGVSYQLNEFNIVADETNILNTNYEGVKITENQLVIVKTELKSSLPSKSLFLKDFSLKIKNMKFYPTSKYNKQLFDIGEVYNNDILTDEYQNYIFVYEIPQKYKYEKMYFCYNDKGYNFVIKLNPKNQKNSSKKIKNKENELMSFDKTLGNVSFKIKNYEIEDKYKINYNYCIKDNCFDSIEYLRPSIDQNFDKTILRLDADYQNNTELSIYNFYDLLEKFGSIYYKVNNEWKIQNENFEQIISNKKLDKYIYIGVNQEIKNAKNIKFVFNIRGTKYEYLIK